MPEAATAPAPAPVSTGGAPTRSSGPNMDVAFSAFDTLVAPPAPETAPEPAPAPEAKSTAPDAPKEQAQAPKPGDKPDQKVAPDQKTPVPDAKAPPQKAATLREVAQRAQSEAKEFREKYEKLVAESAKPKTDAEKDQLLKEREAWQKEKADLENEIKFTAYERSQEFKDKYQAPFLNAYEGAKKLMPALTFKDADKTDAYGEITEAGKLRKATDADWDTLMSISDEDAANKFIADHFGHNAARVTLQREKVLELHSQGLRAVDDYRKQGAERETKMRETSAREQEASRKLWHETNAMAAEKFPQYFAPDPADAKGNELLAHGARLTDLAFGALSPEEVAQLPAALQAKMVNGKLPPDEMTRLHSAVRNRSAAYDRLIYRDNQKSAEIKELRDKLKGYEASEPQRGQERKAEAKTKTGIASTLEEIDAQWDRLAAGNA